MFISQSIFDINWFKQNYFAAMVLALYPTDANLRMRIKVTKKYKR